MSILQALSDSPLVGIGIDALNYKDKVLARLRAGTESFREVVAEALGNCVPDSVAQFCEDAFTAASYAASGMDGGIEEEVVK